MSDHYGLSKDAAQPQLLLPGGTYNALPRSRPLMVGCEMQTKLFHRSQGNKARPGKGQSNYIHHWGIAQDRGGGEKKETGFLVVLSMIPC
jgi:hypothetical protein